MQLGIKSAFSDYSAPSLCPTQPYKLVSSMKGEYFNCTAKSVSSVSSSHSSDHNGCAVSPPTGFVYCDCDSASVQSTNQHHPNRHLRVWKGRDTFDGEVFEFVVFFEGCDRFLGGFFLAFV